jgi:hypothetical protein
MSQFANDVKFVSTTAGTASFTIGAAVSGFQKPSSAQDFISGVVYSYSARTHAGQFESGSGICNGVTQARTTVNDGSSGAGVKVNFSDAPTVVLTVLSQDMLNLVAETIIVGGGTVLSGLGIGGATVLGAWTNNVSSYGALITYDTGSGGPTNVNAALQMINYSQDGFGDGLNMAYARGTRAFPLIVHDGDQLGATSWFGFDGVSFQLTAQIYAIVEGTPTVDSVPTALVFTAGDDITTSERMRISTPIAATITPLIDTVSVGLNVNQEVMDNGTVLSDISPFSGWNSVVVRDYTNQHAFGLWVEETLLGPDWSPNIPRQKTGIGTECLVLATPTGTGPQQIVGINATARAAANMPNGDLFGANLVAQADATVRNLIGCEHDLNNNSTVTGAIIGVQVGHVGNNGGLGADVGYTLGSDGSGKGWNYGYSWFANSMLSTGTLMGSPSSITVKNGVDLSGTTFTGAPILAPLMTPANSTATGVTGAIKWDASFVYICTTTNNWKRSALSSF